MYLQTIKDSRFFAMFACICSFFLGMLLKDPLIGKKIYIPVIQQKTRSTKQQKTHTARPSKKTMATYSKRLCMEATDLFYMIENNNIKNHFKYLGQIIATQKQKNKISSIPLHSHNLFRQTQLLTQSLAL